MDSALTRRDVVRGGLAGGAVLLTGAPFVEAAARRDLRRGRLVRGGAFPTGVLSGVPGADGSITISALVDGLERTGRVRIDVATDPGFRKVVARETALANPIRDYVVKRTLRSDRLRPGEQYFYRVVTRDESSPVGRFRIPPPAGSADPIRIGFFSCQKYHQGYFTAHRGLAAEPDLDLVVSLGDYVYEEPGENQLVADRPDRTGTNGDGDVQSLADYRAKWRYYQADPDLRAMHAAHPFAAIWDDHEAEDDYAAQNEGDPRRPRRVPYLERRRAGYLTYFEHLPIPRLASDPFRIYGSLQLGQAELFLLDERQYRDDQACEGLRPCPEGEAPGRSLLGGTQRAWLQDALTRSTAPWKVLANQVMMMSLDVGTPGVAGVNSDQWDGYADERRILMEHVLAKGIRDVTVLTGDIHTFFAGTVTTTGRVSGTPAATEFVGGSVTSTGISESLANMGLPGSPEQQAEALRSNNPHIAYAEFKSRGYGVMELRSDECLVTYRSPETVLTPGAPVRDLARFRVARGSTVVERR